MQLLNIDRKNSQINKCVYILKQYLTLYVSSLTLAAKEMASFDSYDSGRGLVLSITNCFFGKLDENEEGTIKYRQGSEIDISKISTCFAGRYMNVDFIEKVNSQAYEIKKEIKNLKLKLKNGPNYKFMMILIGSHGTTQDGKTFIFDTENKLLDLDDEVIAPFYNHEFHEFAGRPKIFIFNCCRGLMPYRFEPKHDGIIASQKKLIKTEKYKGDMCIVWSTTDGTKSLRLPNEGSPLIQTLCQTIIEKSKYNSLSSTEFASLIKEVQWKVSSDNRVQIDIEDKLAKPFYLTCKGNFLLLYF